jgi:hypothetical protein
MEMCLGVVHSLSSELSVEVDVRLRGAGLCLRGRFLKIPPLITRLVGF